MARKRSLFTRIIKRVERFFNAPESAQPVSRPIQVRERAVSVSRDPSVPLARYAWEDSRTRVDISRRIPWEYAYDDNKDRNHPDPRRKNFIYDSGSLRDDREELIRIICEWFTRTNAVFHEGTADVKAYWTNDYGSMHWPARLSTVVYHAADWDEVDIAHGLSHSRSDWQDQGAAGVENMWYH